MKTNQIVDNYKNMPTNDKYYCRRCNRLFPPDVLEFGWRHRIIAQNGPDVFHGVEPVDSIAQLKQQTAKADTP